MTEPLNQSNPQFAPENVSLITYTTNTALIDPFAGMIQNKNLNQPAPVQIVVKKDTPKIQKKDIDPKLLLNTYNYGQNYRNRKNTTNIKSKTNGGTEVVKDDEESVPRSNLTNDIIEMYTEYNKFQMLYIIFGIFISICLTIIKKYIK